MNNQEAQAIKRALDAAERIVAARLWEIETDWLREGAVTVAVVNLKDALQLLSQHDLRVDFKDDIADGDITDLVARYRNAACHFGTPSRMVGQEIRTSFSTIVGRGGAIQIGQWRPENPYSDDVAYFYGNHMIFHVRHLQRAVREAKTKLETAVIADL